MVIELQEILLFSRRIADAREASGDVVADSHAGEVVVEGSQHTDGGRGRVG